jgi:hypothetical protein
MRIAMSRNKSTAFRPISLTYSAPAVDTTSTAPNFFYNAFPELNDVAPDDSRSAFPRRAKYLLPLHCTFNPCGTFKRDGRYHFLKPRDPANEWPFEILQIFEWVHQALAATRAKLIFRLFLLGPFYTTLDKFLSSDRAISVPLIPNPDGNDLQRLWSHIARWFEVTRLTDELYSLLATMALISDKETRNSCEKEFIEHEDKELPGFANLYRELRDHCEHSYGRLESCTTTMQLGWATNVLERGRKAYEARFPMLVNSKGSLEATLHPTVTPDQLRHRFDNLTRGPANCLEAIQWLIGYEAIQDKHHASFPQDDFEAYFTLEIAQDVINTGRCRIMPHISQRMVKSIIKGITKGNGSHVGKSEAVDTATYMVFLEAIRQQLCTGVGLRCPFWNGKCCGMSIYKKLLARVWQIATPRAVPFVQWNHHWRRPPCLA